MSGLSGTAWVEPEPDEPPEPDRAGGALTSPAERLELESVEDALAVASPTTVPGVGRGLRARGDVPYWR
jgi:hypothetical protein